MSIFLRSWAAYTGLTKKTRSDIEAASETYKVYTADLTQNVNASTIPVPIVFLNTIGDITWSMPLNGVYRANSAGLFTIGKTFLPQFGNSNNDYGVGLMVVSGGQSYSGFMVAEIIDASTIEFRLWIKNGANTSFLNSIYQEINPATIPIKIEVYP